MSVFNGYPAPRAVSAVTNSQSTLLTAILQQHQPAVLRLLGGAGHDDEPGRGDGPEQQRHRIAQQSAMDY